MRIKQLFLILALLCTMVQGAWATGELTGVFSVSASKKVCFSKGNLQLVGENSWKFADNQWDYFGNSQSDNHRDLFGWGTGNNPNQTSEDNDNYGTFTDWGNNSFLQAQLGTGWRTLSNDEWHYLFKTRTVKDGTGAGHSYTLGQSVNGRLGVVIYPDGYTGTLYTGSDWSTFEAAGCVFLPAAGTRYGNGVGNTDKGYYWSSTPNFKFASNAAYSVHISDQLYTENSPFYCSNGQSVRLVRLVKDAYTATFADGNDNTDWTITPTSGVEGTNVTATYSGSRHVKSVTYRPAGTIGGKFTVNSSGDKVYFSKGNLQYIGSAATPYWKFADNQWDCLGTSTGQNSSATNVDRDLFGWGTVATPNKTSEDDDYSSDNAWGDDPYLQACLGTGWHLMVGGNYGEWNYLLNSRTTTSGIRYAVGNVNGKNGLILLPDDWNAEYYALNNTNKDNGHYDNNNISLSDWTEKLEAHGAVFLPAGGHRIGTKLYVVNDIGHYWCSTRQANGDVMRIDEDLILPNWALDFYYGCSIRLVRDVAE